MLLRIGLSYYLYLLRFDSSQKYSQDRIIDVKLGDFLNIICPTYSFNENPQQQPYAMQQKIAEYHTIYRVSRQEYDECKIKHIELKQPILKCDRPSESVKYTLYISKFSPVPDAIEFSPGQEYYFISTSNGLFSGLNNAQDGTCKSNNMKIIIRVQDESPKKPPRTSPSTKVTITTTTTTTTAITATSHKNKNIITDAITSQMLPLLQNSPFYVIGSHNNNENEAPSTDISINYKSLIHHRTSSSTQKPFRFITSSRRGSKTTTTTSNRNENDNIFILEPDQAEDYSDILSELIKSESSSSIISSSSTNIYNSDLYSDEEQEQSSLHRNENLYYSSSSVRNRFNLAHFYIFLALVCLFNFRFK